MITLNFKRNKDFLLRFSSFLLCVIALLIMSHSMYLPAKAWLSQQLIMLSWEQTKITKDPSPPWPWADTTAIAKLEILRLNKSIILLKGTDPTTLAFSAGAMHQFSTLTNNSPFVAAGHRDTHFSFLENIQLQDIIKLNDIHGNTNYYEVENIDIIDSSTTPLLLDVDTAMLHLITCYPFNAMRAGGSLRYMVKAKKIIMNGSEVS